MEGRPPGRLHLRPIADIGCQCDPGGKISPPATVPTSLSFRRKILRLPIIGPIIVALEKGYFAEEGLEVTLIEPADPNDPPKLVAAGKAELAVSYQPQLHMQAAAGLPLARVGTLIATPLNTLLVLDDG
ncbi:MAG: ABC transporter substrate-binding protein, partial [Bacteroidetes bacterium]|nr:ABC transporter substrate-binding protein [Bacteroidota bacterium]